MVRWMDVFIGIRMFGSGEGSTGGGVEVETEDAQGLGDALRVLVAAVAGGHDFFRERAIEMGTPVGDDSIGGLRRISAATITDDGVIMRFRTLRGEETPRDGIHAGLLLR